MAGPCARLRSVQKSSKPTVQIHSLQTDLTQTTTDSGAAALSENGGESDRSGNRAGLATGGLKTADSAAEILSGMSVSLFGQAAARTG